MKKYRLFAWFAVVVAALGGILWWSRVVPQRRAPSVAPRSGPPHLDLPSAPATPAGSAVRPAANATGPLANADLRAALPGHEGRLASLEQARVRRRAAAESLQAKVPGVRVDFDDVLGSPAFVASTSGFLASSAALAAGPGVQGPAVGDPQRVVKAFIDEHAAMFGHTAAVLGEAKLVRDYETPHNGMHTYVWQQELDGVRVFESTLQAHVTKAGDLINIASRLVPDTSAAAPNHAATLAAPSIDVKAAIGVAGADVGDPVAPTQIAENAAAEGPARKQQFRSTALLGISAENVWAPIDEATLRLAWEITFASKRRGEMYRSVVDAQTGEVLVRQSLTNYISNASYRVFTSDSPTPMSPGLATPGTTQPPEVARTLVTLSAVDTTASPNGWIDDGVNETRGNNVDAHLDLNADNIPDTPRPQGSPARNFDFPLDLTQPPSAYRDAAVTQLFYWCNFMHDRLYQLGFTEAAGNFQVNNFGRGGNSNDPVQADAQDGSGTNNANFSTPADGSSGRIQMFLWTGPTPARDGDFDAEVVLHEYTHGLSNRLVGGGVGISSLQTSGMGEGWSDFFGITLLTEAGDDVNGNWARGGYSRYGYGGTFTQNYYFGGRRYPYSTNLGKNPLTFKDIDPAQASTHTGIPVSPIVGSTANEVHNMGEVWCVTLWDARAALINKHGFTVGNQLILQLATDGMKLGPSNPTFLQARDAIIQADLVDNAGANRGELWSAFAKRGMGANASSPASTTTTGLVENFDFPDTLKITPAGMATASGPIGGPFQSATFTLTNSGTSTLSWSAADNQPWLDLAPASGTLAAGATVTVTASFNLAASALAKGNYTGTVNFTNATSSLTQSRSIGLTVLPLTVSLFAEDFESGTLDPAKWATSGTGTWRTQVTSANEPHGGTKHMTMDSSLDGSDSRNEATLTLNLAGQSGVTLTFWAKGFNDEPNGPPIYPFSGGADFDGVAVSADGTTWYEVQGLRTLTSAWQQFSVDVDAAIAAAGISYTAAFKIRFNQYDNYTIPTDGIAIDDIVVAHVVDNRLTLTLPASLDENAAPVSGTVTAAPSPANDLVVNLSSNVPVSLGVPATVTIPAGQISATFALTPIDDPILNGTRTVTISAAAVSPWAGSSANVAVQDNESATLSIALPSPLNEGAGAVSGSVSVSAAPSTDVVVNLSSSNSAEILVPASVVIPAGQTSASFTATLVDDSRIDGAVTTTITASVANWTPGSVEVTVLDNESTALTLNVPAAIREGDGSASCTVQIGGTSLSALTVSLTSDDTSELVVPSTVTIPAGQTSASFNITVMDDSLRDGVQTAHITAHAASFTDAVSTTTVADNDVHHFVLGAVGSPQLSGQAFAMTVTAKDVNDVTITNYNTATPISSSIAITPSVLTGWVNGVWSGYVTATALGTNLQLTVSDGAGHTGVSNAFDVTIGPFAKFGWSTIPSPQTQDTYFAAIVTAQDVAGNTISSYNGTATLQASVPGVSQQNIGTGTGTWTYPMYTAWHDSRTQVIYLASEIGGARKITSLALNVIALPGQPLNAWTIRMKHTSLASYSTASWDGSGWTTVYQANTTVSQTGWVTFTFTTPFDYDGTSNLLVDFSHNNTTYTSAGSVQTTTAPSSRAVYYYTDSGYGDPLTWSGTAVPANLSTNVPNLRLGFLDPASTFPIDPPVTANFSNGSWSGYLSLPVTGSGVTLIAKNSAGISGASNAFDVQTAAAPSQTGTAFSETFESGTLGSAWTISGTNHYHAIASSANSPHAGSWHLTMDSSTYDGTYSRNEATLTVNLAGRTGVTLSFWAKSFSDTPNGPPTIPFSGGADFDGVAISANGTTWYEVQALRSLTGTWSKLTVNLDAAIATYGLSYNSTFKIRFNQYGYAYIPYNGIAIDDILITAAVSPLTVTVPAQVVEGAGTLSGTVQLPVAVGTPTTVSLTSSAPAKVAVPASVIIPAGQTTASFVLGVSNNAIIDGNRNVLISASTANALGSATVSVLDDDRATMALSAAASATEGDAKLTGTFTLSSAPSIPLTFALVSSDTTAATVPATVTVKAGETSATFAISIVDDDVLDGTQTTTITASASGWTGAMTTIDVLDNETPTVSLTLAANAREGDAPLSGTVTAGFTPATALTVTLDSSDTSELTVPASVTIPAGSRVAAFSATIVDDAETDGSQTATVSASVAGLTGDTKTVTIADNDVHHFALSPVPSPVVRNAAVPLTVAAKDVNDVTIPTYTSTTAIAAAAGQTAVALSLSTLTGWTNGTWSGSIKVTDFATGAVLTVAPGAAVASSSNVFDVVLGGVDHFAVSPVGTTQTQQTPFSLALTAQDAGNNTVTPFNGDVSLNVATPVAVPVLSWTRYATSSYGNTKFAISRYFTNYTDTSTTVTDPTQLAALLAGKQVFLVPEQRTAPAGMMGSLGTAWAEVLKDFVNNGGIVIVCSYSLDEHALLVNAGLMTATKGTAVSSTQLSPSTPTTLNAGIPSIFTCYDVSPYSASNGITSVRTYTGSQSVVLSRDIGAGHVVLIGSDFYYYGTSMDRVIANAVAWAEKTTLQPLVPANAKFSTGAWSSLVNVPFTGTRLQIVADDGEGHTGKSGQFAVQVRRNPTISGVQDQTIDEDSSTASIHFTVGDAQTPVSALVVTAASSNPALVDQTGVALGADGADRTIALTPLPDAHGTTQITLTVTDGDGLIATTQFLLTVNSVNDAPSFTKGGDQSVAQNAGLQTIPAWATDISTGPADESEQAVRFVVAADQPQLFAVQPVIAADGALSFTPASDMSGTATVTVVLQDDGGTTHGGVDHSAVEAFTVAIGFVNDAPSFIVGAGLEVPQDAGPQSFPGWATGISAGPADEAGQALNFLVSTDHPELFVVQPSISANGTLRFAPAPTASGTAQVTVQLHDDGGTANGGGDTSASQSFSIAVTTYAEEIGSYTGLVRPAAGGALDAAHFGLVRVNIGRKGAITGQLVVGGVGAPFKGSLDQAGVAHFGPVGGTTFVYSPRGAAPLYAGFKVDVANGSDTLSGSIHDGLTTFGTFTADRAAFATTPAGARRRDLPQDQGGNYTLVFSALNPDQQDSAGTEFPRGDGAGTAKLLANGTVRVAATLADGRKIAYASALSKALSYPLYCGDAGGFALSGAPAFRDMPGVSDIDAAGVLWFQPGKAGSFYPNGWPAGIRTDLVGAKYRSDSSSPVVGSLPAVGATGNAMLTFNDGGLSAALVQPFNITAPAHAQAVVSNSSKVSLTFTRATGLFAGKFTHPATGKPARFNGAVLQKQSGGAGAFRTDALSGGVRLEPQH